MSVASEENKRPLFDISLSLGEYEKLDPLQIEYIYREHVVPDPDNLLDYVMNRPQEITGPDHAKLLRVIVSLGYKTVFQ